MVAATSSGLVTEDIRPAEIAMGSSSPCAIVVGGVSIVSSGVIGEGAFIAAGIALASGYRSRSSMSSMSRGQTRRIAMG